MMCMWQLRLLHNISVTDEKRSYNCDPGMSHTNTLQHIRRNPQSSRISPVFPAFYASCQKVLNSSHDLIYCDVQTAPLLQTVAIFCWSCCAHFPPGVYKGQQKFNRLQTCSSLSRMSHYMKFSSELKGSLDISVCFSGQRQYNPKQVRWSHKLKAWNWSLSSIFLGGLYCLMSVCTGTTFVCAHVFQLAGISQL